MEGLPLDALTPVRPRWPGRSARGSVVLPLADEAFAGLPSLCVLPECRMARKLEFHLTLLSSQEAAAVECGLPVQAWAARFQALHWSLRLTGEAWLLHESTAEAEAWSLVACATCPSLDAFRQAIALASGVPLPDAPAHVTLFTTPGSRGIGLPSREVFRALRVRPVPGAASGRGDQKPP
ncbi:hypothetical protein [Marilutibacter aestuarii]|uniref:2'-5' RNA ligase family protein n=1 Tax=Marilutibacter aestuarii TaxID=1706195 RepID=A0A508A194_9GAMM|nr:hypothetical protein [Lysobacter aestuarii]TQD42194.1 hypothetical protein FKV25_12030 [Lysobacter aestuarii]